MTHIQGVILDVDGTLVDSNDAHTKSWVDAWQNLAIPSLSRKSVP
jgi:beta-phosphoglucomutase-like phosphatase (HAD superfamily)